MDLMETLKKVPWWGWAGGGGVALGGLWFLHNKSQQATPAQQASSAPIPSGLNASDLAGLPFGYQDYAAANPIDSYSGQYGSPLPVPPPYSPPGWPSSPPGPPEPAPTPPSPPSPQGPPGPMQPPPVPAQAMTLQYGIEGPHLPSDNPWLEHWHPPVA